MHGPTLEDGLLCSICCLHAKEDRAWKWKYGLNARAGRVAAGEEVEAAAATHSAMGQAAATNAGACRVAAGAETEPSAAAHSAKGQAATASNLRWQVLTVDDTLFAPPLPQDGETVHRVNHLHTKLRLCFKSWIASLVSASTKIELNTIRTSSWAEKAGICSVKSKRHVIRRCLPCRQCRGIQVIYVRLV